jgi:hypothetical protein
VQKRQAFTPIAKLKQVKLLLHTLDARLKDFHQVLPKLNPRIGLVNLGGYVLKFLFGTATMSDAHLLHDVVSDLQLKNLEIVQSLENHLTYVKISSTSSKINAEGIANLSQVVKDKVIQSHDELLSIARDLLWLNASLFGQHTLVHVRQLEFSLTQEIDKLFSSTQSAIQERLSTELVNPVVFQDILRNVSLLLPEGYELVAGTNSENIRLYYERTEISVAANAHFIRLVLNIPLQTANRHLLCLGLLPCLSA